MQTFFLFLKPLNAQDYLTSIPFCSRRGLICSSSLGCCHSSKRNTTLQGWEFPSTAQCELRTPCLGYRPKAIYHLEMFQLLFKKVETHFKKAHISPEVCKGEAKNKGYLPCLGATKADVLGYIIHPLLLVLKRTSRPQMGSCAMPHITKPSQLT